MSAGPEKLVDAFAAALRDLRAEPHRVPEEGATPTVLRSIVDRHRAAKVVVADLPARLRPVVARSLTGLSVRFLDETPSVEVVSACAAADVGITWVEYAVAEDGAIVEVARDDAGRLAAALPVVHIALLSPDRLVGNLGEGIAVAGRILRSSPPGRRPTITFISGPSRTADIELRLLYGVHGPHSLHVMLLDWFAGG